MAIQADSTDLSCAFCTREKRTSKLIRSMHGLYCEELTCYTRISSGNLVPPSACERCGENSFYFENENGEGIYKCIACAHEEQT